jgi:TolB protein
VAPPLPAGQQGNRQQVPWAQVGPGWFLAEWSPAAPHAPGQGHSKPAATTLFLVDPAGGRYVIETLPPLRPPWSRPEDLVAWSGDGQRALLVNGPWTKAAVLDLRTAASTRFTLGSNVTPIGFTAPDGLAIIANTDSGSNRPGLERLSLAGARELAYPASFSRGGHYTGTAAYSANGTELAVGTSAGVELVSNAGPAIRFLPVGPLGGSCSVVRWWTAADLLVNCVSRTSAIPQLWLVPATGARPAALTARPAARGDLGDLDAWRLPAGTFVQDAGACGYTYVAKLRPSHRTAPVTIPGLAGGTGTVVAGALGDRLAVRSRPGCGEGGELVWFAPATNAVTPLLGGAVNGGSVTEVVMFGAR